MFRSSTVSSLYRRTIRKVLPHRQPDVGLVDNTIVGGIKAQPSIAGEVGLYPGMGCSFSPHAACTRAYITAEIPCRIVHNPDHHQQNLGKILTTSRLNVPVICRVP